MGKSTGIEWTDATFNPWWGCERVSPACAHCYADSVARRSGFGIWDNERHRFFGDRHWQPPLAWNAAAEAKGKPLFVFCASMADVFEDHPELDSPRERLWQLIDETPWLVWLLLTKRPENIAAMTANVWGAAAPANVWLGTSIENARWSFRVAQLTEVEAPAHFLSCEPLLGSLYESRGNREPLELTHVEWVIGGGESGPRHRACNPDHARELRDACRAAGVPFFWKQWGGRTPKAGGKTLDGREYCERPTPKAPSPALSLF